MGQQIVKNKKINFLNLSTFPLVFLSIFLIRTGRFLHKYFDGATADQIIFFLTTPMEGVDSKMVHIFLLKCVYQSIPITLIICFLPRILKIITHFTKKIKHSPPEILKLPVNYIKNITYEKSVIIISIITSLITLCCIFGFIIKSFFRETSDFYEKHLSFPKIENIKFNKKKNIILLSLESMESTFKDKEFFGTSLIPDLEELENDGVQFSNFMNGYTTDFTQGATIALYTGIQPYINPALTNKKEDSMSPMKSYWTLGNILKHNGYNTSAIMAGNSKFSSTGSFLTNNGIDEVIDQKTIQELYPNKENYDWGFDDDTVIETLKNKIIEYSKINKPFFIYTQTVDTHFNYLPYKPECDAQEEICKNQYKSLIYNTNKIIANFIKWLQTQPIYKNSTIIIIGDHLRMGKNFDVPETRNIYNLFLNSSEPPTTNKKFTQIDLFPTVLEAAGAEIKGHKLGLGTSLFSDENTLAERYSEEFLDSELGKNNKLKNYIWTHKE